MPNGSGSGYDRVTKAFDPSEKRDPNGRWTGIRIGTATPSDIAKLRAAHASGDKTATHALTRLANESNSDHKAEIASAPRPGTNAALGKGRGTADVASIRASEQRRRVMDANKKNRDELARMHQRRAEAPSKQAAAERRNAPFTIGAASHETLKNADTEVAAPGSRDVGDWSDAQVVEHHSTLNRAAKETGAGPEKAEISRDADKVARERKRRGL